MNGHTPGPWQIDEPHKEYVRIIGGIDGDAYDDGTPRVMYTHVCDVLDNDSEQANARLIAAAPTLLDELVSIIELFPLPNESDLNHTRRIMNLSGKNGEDLSLWAEARVKKARAAIAKATEAA